ncbi:hypothetical protein GCM10010245_91140 [Streptomyces spectabilis]|nr:hypothetical protein GCM10010245_91140 [Streptomyces spectabilis]
MFGDRGSGAYLLKFAWTKIVQHQLVKGRASPHDPVLESYRAERRRKGRLHRSTASRCACFRHSMVVA